MRSMWKENYLLEFGPNTVLPTPELFELIEGINLQDEMLLADEKAPRFIQYKGSLHAVPMSPSAFLKSNLVSLLGKLRLFLEPFIPPQKKEMDESIASFFRRRIGNEMTENLLYPYVSGVWAGDPETLSIRSCFPPLYNWEKEHGNLFLGLLHSSRTKRPYSHSLPKGLVNFTNGLESLAVKLANHLSHAIVYGEKIEELIPPLSPNQFPRWKIRTQDTEYTADHVIMTLPADTTAKLVKPFAAGTAWTLSDIPYVPIAVVHLAIPKKNMAFEPKGFGFLVAPSEKSDILGCIFSSTLFPNRAPKDMALLTVLVGGALHGEKVFLNDSILINKVFSSLLPVLKFKEFPNVVSIFRYEKAIPQFTLGHSNRLSVFQNLQRSFPGIIFAGNYTHGVAVGSVVETAKKAISEVALDRKTNPRPTMPTQMPLPLSQ